jgi:hypothetical protein
MIEVKIPRHALTALVTGILQFYAIFAHIEQECTNTEIHGMRYNYHNRGAEKNTHLLGIFS